uniref:Uncharacterized protein n=1 Tax=Panagrolaimus davidi TaxID=227884 RepID=A0A914PK96_9BILA
MSNLKKTYALLTVSSNEKELEILTFNDAEIILGNKYSGKDFMEDASNYLLDLKNSKTLEGVILDFYCHENPEFLHEIRRCFSEFCEIKVILFRLVLKIDLKVNKFAYHVSLLSKVLV